MIRIKRLNVLSQNKFTIPIYFAKRKLDIYFFAPSNSAVRPLRRTPPPLYSPIQPPLKKKKSIKLGLIFFWPGGGAVVEWVKDLCWKSRHRPRNRIEWRKFFKEIFFFWRGGGIGLRLLVEILFLFFCYCSNALVRPSVLWGPKSALYIDFYFFLFW